ncbi:MAG TPA: hypothetical protein VHK01_20670 [Lacipirellulaceae bacterium]|jgi:hypothetical protein|nr:hypothetical protein [Lacipirellulaceae bacterium]
MMKSSNSESFRLRWLIVSIAGYIVMIVTIVWSLRSARDWALAELATPESIRKWEAWREDVRQQDKQAGPVRRRVPKSAEPPALVLMRDYFAVSLVGAMLFMTLLYWVIAWFVRGILQSRGIGDG